MAHSDTVRMTILHTFLAQTNAMDYQPDMLLNSNFNKLVKTKVTDQWDCSTAGD